MADYAVPRYKPASVAFHWLTLLLMVAIYATIELHELFARGSEIREAFEQWHFWLGLLLFVVVLMRLGVNLSYRAPPINPPLPEWQHWITQLMKIYLYFLMISMPILGWLQLSAEGEALSFFGIPLPAIASESEPLAEFAHEAHEIIGISGYFLITVHALAALYHHYMVKDDTLKRMLPKPLDNRR